jgi:hypothetical protein
LGLPARGDPDPQPHHHSFLRFIAVGKPRYNNPYKLLWNPKQFLKGSHLRRAQDPRNICDPGAILRIKILHPKILGEKMKHNQPPARSAIFLRNPKRTGELEKPSLPRKPRET